MITIRFIDTCDLNTLREIITGYVSNQMYRVAWSDGPDITRFQLELIRLAQPYVKRFEMEDQAYCDEIVAAGHSFAAYDGDRMIGIALAEVRAWNRTFWVHELHVRPECYGRGVGRALVSSLVEHARSASCRTVVVETQNTNVPAIRFYRRMGFRIEAVDISLYSNDDLTGGEVALFMKRRLDRSR